MNNHDNRLSENPRCLEIAGSDVRNIYFMCFGSVCWGQTEVKFLLLFWAMIFSIILRVNVVHKCTQRIQYTTDMTE